ncbi:MBL fold metallo-hydrolase [Pigmentibacter ruber]|uniref:ComEC/Rec2 family competence protein n=1 Tax=Pigmentibacter ruber TaxID=2683196 RepID=UPI00131AC741|nr:ComEC/Rec2 family competence protein [Pigmentibacter ruber]
MQKFTIFIQAFFNSIACYLLTFCIIFFIHEFFNYGEYFKNFLDLSNIFKSKSVSIAENMKEKDLALNFLANIRKITFQDRLIFEYSGLIHLLAISGSQITPTTNIIVNGIKYIIYFLKKKNTNPLKIMILINKIKIYLSIIISFFISSIFGFSGALVRVISINYVSKINLTSLFYAIIFPIFPNILFTTFKNCILLIFFSFIFGNLLINLSFILSFFGVLCLKIIIRMNNLLNFNNLFSYVTNTVLTSFIIGILLSPFSNCNIFSSCLANLVATPIICFLITPLTFLLLILPENNLFSLNLIYLYDISLTIFKNIGLIFSDYNQLYTNSNKTSLFSLYGLLYINSAFVILISIYDLIKNYNILITRFKINSIKIS